VALHRNEVLRGYGNLCESAEIMCVEAIEGNWSMMRSESGAGVVYLGLGLLGLLLDCIDVQVP
jgi:hypothetical protein